MYALYGHHVVLSAANPQVYRNDGDAATHAAVLQEHPRRHGSVCLRSRGHGSAGGSSVVVAVALAVVGVVVVVITVAM